MTDAACNGTQVDTDVQQTTAPVDREFPTNPHGYRALLAWLGSFGQLELVGGGTHRRIRRGAEQIPVQRGCSDRRNGPAGPQDPPDERQVQRDRRLRRRARGAVRPAR